ncbi:MAG: flagellar filament capping protein FliD [Planctomycetes bacterium]|nr:flagellar filament capping protein FliD [Planctomycetota bacterium]
MSGISSSVGLFSGIDSKALIDQLLAVDARPKTLVQNRIVQLQQQQAAFLDLNTSLLAFKTAAGNFATNKVFDSSRATTSDDKVLTASAAANASAGSYTFSVARLVTTQQYLSRGFVDKTTAAGATKFTFETGGGNIATETTLSELNGSNGVSRGKVILTDTSSGAGATATIDLSTAVTVNDVLEAINNNGKVNVTASVQGDRIKLTAGSGVTSFSLSSATGGRTAEDLGIAGNSSSGAITGTRVRTISANTALKSLNDGNGVNIRDGAQDIVVTTRSGQTVNIQLGLITHTEVQPDGSNKTIVDQNRAVTLGDVVTIFNKQAKAALGNQDNQLTLAINADGTGLVVTDNTAGAANTTVTSQNGRTTAEDLGIATAGTGGGVVNGKRLVSSINSRLTASLLGGSGLASGALTVTDRAGNSKSITVSAGALAGSVTDVISEINAALADTGGGPAVQVKAGLNRAGNGIALTDSSGGAGNIVVSGALGDALGLTTAGSASNSLDGKNLQTRWISRATNLKDLNLGKGIGTGTIRVTDTQGAVYTFDIKDTLVTVDDFIQQLNSQFTAGITAKVNDNGDGVEIVDTKGGTAKLKVEDTSGGVAKALNLLGESEGVSGTARRNGSYEKTVNFNASDSLESVVNAINAASVGATAALIRDGSSGTPFRISFTARDSGSLGRTVIDSGSLDLGLSTLSKGDDAVAFFGNADPARAILLTSSTNTLDQVVQGVSVSLKTVSTTPVTVTVTRDQDAIEKSIKDFVDSFNKVLATMDKYDTYNSETNRRGVLLGDTTVSQIKNQLLSAVQGTPTGVSGQFSRLFQVGVKIGSGSKLEFDTARFRTAYAADPQNVEDLFAASKLAAKEPIEVAPGVTIANTKDTYTSLGVAEGMKVLIDRMTNSVDGSLTTRNKTIDTQITQQRGRITSLDASIAAKRARLEAQFLNMEKAIGQLRTQSNALSSVNFGG